MFFWGVVFWSKIMSHRIVTKVKAYRSINLRLTVSSSGYGTEYSWNWDCWPWAMRIMEMWQVYFVQIMDKYVSMWDIANICLCRYMKQKYDACHDDKTDILHVVTSICMGNKTDADDWLWCVVKHIRKPWCFCRLYTLNRLSGSDGVSFCLICIQCVKRLRCSLITYEHNAYWY